MSRPDLRTATWNREYQGKLEFLIAEHPNFVGLRAQVAEAAGEYKRLRTEQLRVKKEHEQTVQHTHPNDPKALITDM